MRVIRPLALLTLSTTQPSSGKFHVPSTKLIASAPRTHTILSKTFTARLISGNDAQAPSPTLAHWPAPSAVCMYVKAGLARACQRAQHELVLASSLHFAGFTKMQLDELSQSKLQR
jgi:hypothetical protein